MCGEGDLGLGEYLDTLIKVVIVLKIIGRNIITNDNPFPMINWALLL